MSSGNELKASCNTPKVAMAERMQLAVKGMPSRMHIPKVKTEMRRGDNHTEYTSTAHAMQSFRSQPYSPRQSYSIFASHFFSQAWSLRTRMLHRASAVAFMRSSFTSITLSWYFSWHFSMGVLSKRVKQAAARAAIHAIPTTLHNIPRAMRISNGRSQQW